MNALNMGTSLENDMIVCVEVGLDKDETRVRLDGANSNVEFLHC